MTTTLAASTRNDSTGKGAARKLRAQGQVPAVLYGYGREPRSISVDPKALLDIFHASQNRNTVVELDIDGEKHPTMVREVQRHPVSRAIRHVDFYRLSDDRKVEVMVPVTTTGRPAGAVLGGQVRIIRRVLKVRCLWNAIPDHFEVDVSPMNIGDMIKASEITAPEGVEIVIDHDFNVINLFGRRASAGKKKEAKKGK